MFDLDNFRVADLIVLLQTSRICASEGHTSPLVVAPHRIPLGQVSMEIQPTTNRKSVCFDAINVIYRNAMVQHIRSSLMQSYPTDWQSKLRSPFAKEWDSIKSNAELTRKSGEVLTPLADEFDLLSVNHFYNLIELYFDDLFPSSLKDTDRERRQTRQALMTWARTVKQMRDPITGHPGEEDVAIEDALMILDAARRLLNSVDQDASDTVAEMWEGVRSSGITSPSESKDEDRILEASTLPSRETIAPAFVGRQTELSELNDWFNDERSRVRLLAGDGGKGKTAIAYQFALALLNDPPAELEIVVWLSAKARRFVDGGAFDIEAPDFFDLHSALDWVLRAYGAIGFEEMDVAQKEEQCIEYLTRLPGLVILDDVDSLEGEGLDAMNFFMHRTYQTESKFLLTSRRIPFGMEPNTKSVSGFSAGEDGIAFVTSRLGIYELDLSQFPPRVITRIVEACDGSPLFIQDLLRLCIVGETADEAIRNWRSRGGETARRYALGREFDRLSESARKVLLTCALFGAEVSLSEIQVVAELTELDCRSAIQELQRLFLLPRAPLAGDEPRFALNINTRQLVLDVEAKSDLAGRLTAMIREITGTGNTSQIRRRRYAQYVRQGVSLAKLGEFGAAETTLEQALEIYPESPELHGTLGWVYKIWSPSARNTDARERFLRAADLRATREDTYWHWSHMEQQQHEWTSGAEAAERGLVVLRDSHRLSYMAGLSRSRLAKELYQQAQYGRSMQEAQKAEVHLRAALADLEQLETGQFEFHSRAYRAKSINYETLVRIAQALQDGNAERRYLRNLSDSLKAWVQEHPTDRQATSERNRILSWFGHLLSEVSPLVDN